MDITKIVVASVALVLSGWSLYEADSSSRTLQRPEVMHRSAADEHHGELLTGLGHARGRLAELEVHLGPTGIAEV